MALPNLAPVLTPIQAHAKLLKARYPDALIAFITPCISKKTERYSPESQVDFVITFEELETIFQETGIVLQEASAEQAPQYLSRKFPTDGGIIDTLRQRPDHNYVSVSGYHACVQAIRDIQEGKLASCFVEMSLCEGSCIGGPSFRKKEYSLLSSLLQIKKNSAVSAYSEDYNIHYEAALAHSFTAPRNVTHVPPSPEQIDAVLRKMGKRSTEDELNCGMCGYHSCREKAVAILAGKAEINMCLPYMIERAESFSNQIINITPNAIVSVDMDLKVQQINQSACQIFKLAPEDVLKQPVSRILDEFNFVDMIMNNKAKLEKTAFLPEYNAYLNQVFLYDKESGMVVCIMKNISQDRQKRNLAMKKKVQAASLADEIVDKQLRIVHEIASLLGETAAETQIAIRDLKETIMMDDEE
jgi:PAS domain-containing protein